MENSTIAWTNHTFNPWIGCCKVHAGCAFCYAEADQDKRRGRAKWGPNGTRSRTSDDYWRQPRTWDREAAATFQSWQFAVRTSVSEFDQVEPYQRPRVFCASLADVFEDWHGAILDSDGNQCRVCQYCLNGYTVPAGAVLTDTTTCDTCGEMSCYPVTMADLRVKLFALIDATPNLDWLLLTKRPDNIERLSCTPAEEAKRQGIKLCGRPHYYPNVWLGTSISDQPTADKQIPELLKCRKLCPVLFLSCEPLLGPIDRLFDPKRGITGELEEPSSIGQRLKYRGTVDWVIVGGESGAHARPCDIAWIRSIIGQCKATGVPCFVKQLGAKPLPNPLPDVSVRLVRDSKGADPSEWPEDLKIREFPAMSALATTQACWTRRLGAS
ncbi:MAG: phage Gp37/Gp68 family protein [Planctomycetaceae bacterium]|nr:phage Gp37/Gp68 family protein [Planctomycetaceae bacterium]